MSMKRPSLDSILENFDPSPTQLPPKPWQRRKAVTVWLPPEWHARYKALQRESKETFSTKLRELFMAAIAITESRTPPSSE